VTVLTAMMMTLQFLRAISAVVFCCVIAMIAPFAFFFEFIIPIRAGICYWKSALCVANAMSWSIMLGRLTVWSLFPIWRLSAMQEPVVGTGAAAGKAGFLSCHGCTVSHSLVDAGTDVVTTLGVDVVLGIGVNIVIGSWFRICSGFALSSLPYCGCWHTSGDFGPPVYISSVCITPFRPTPSVSTLLSSLCHSCVAATILVTMSVMPLPRSKSSW